MYEYYVFFNDEFMMHAEFGVGGLQYSHLRIKTHPKYKDIAKTITVVVMSGILVQ